MKFTACITSCAPRPWFIRPMDRARRATGGRWSSLRCGGRPFRPTALRCSLRRATSTTRPWVRGLRHVEVVAEYRSNPASLRCSAPQRRAAQHPPATLLGRAVALQEVLFGALDRSGSNVSPMSRCGSQSRGRVHGCAPLRRRGAQGTGGCRAAGAVERSCPSSVGREADKRASSSLAPGHRAPQSSRRAAPTAAAKRRRAPARGFARCACPTRAACPSRADCARRAASTTRSAGSARAARSAKTSPRTIIDRNEEHESA